MVMQGMSIILFRHEDRILTPIIGIPRGVLQPHLTIHLQLHPSIASSADPFWVTSNGMHRPGAVYQRLDLPVPSHGQARPTRTARAPECGPCK